MSRLPAPISDYVTDTKSVLDQSLRILQAITDVAADAGWLDTALAAMLLVQSLMQVSLPVAARDVCHVQCPDMVIKMWCSHANCQHWKVRSGAEPHAGQPACCCMSCMS